MQAQLDELVEGLETFSYEGNAVASLLAGKSLQPLRRKEFEEEVLVPLRGGLVCSLIGRGGSKKTQALLLLSQCGTALVIRPAPPRHSLRRKTNLALSPRASLSPSSSSSSLFPAATSSSSSASSSSPSSSSSSSFSTSPSAP